MRDYLILTVCVLTAAWAFDAAEFDGRYSRAAWEQAVDEGRSISDGIQSAVDSAFSGKCAFCS
jgi:hypothetical protein